MKSPHLTPLAQPATQRSPYLQPLQLPPVAIPLPQQSPTHTQPYTKLWQWRWRWAMGIGPMCAAVLAIFPTLIDSPYVIPPVVLATALSILLNFPDVVPSLQKRPLYLQDVVVEDEFAVSRAHREIWKRKRMYYMWCRLIVNVSTAILIAGCAEYGFTLWRNQDSPTSYMEVCGVLGGVMSLLSRTQNIASRIVLKLCHLTQAWDEKRRKVMQMSLKSIATHHVVNPLTQTQLNEKRAPDEIRDYFLGVV